MVEKWRELWGNVRMERRVQEIGRGLENGMGQEGGE
jgi:hypothetical protein